MNATTARQTIQQPETTTLPPEPIPLATLATRPGIDILRGILAGELPGAPIAEVLDFVPKEVEAGRIVFEGRPSPRFFNPIGSIHGGWIATLLDSALGCAVHSVLPAGKGYTTLELKVNYVRAVMPDTGPVRAEANVIHVGNRVGTAEARLTDASGRLYAHATTTCLVFDFSEKKR